ncbi:MAG: iron-containing alcohol dehydrogenase, partial [Clostridia bacterium]|nr:iron-containing alcohol dehydrogenase [Clostridia bacterium]
IQSLIEGKDISVLAVGSGSIDDICRLATARCGKLCCMFATAPSMDGFASYSAPIVKNGFKSSYPAKSPEVIIGDTAILAKAPARLKSAGFGDMVAKYVGLVDWKISSLLSGEYYCEKIASLTREATDSLMTMADKITKEDEESAGMIFEALLKTGLGMSFAQNSRPASGAEHVVAHLLDCKEVAEGKIPNYHGEDVGVSALETMKVYEEMAEHSSVSVKKEQVNWSDVFAFYGSMAEEIRKLNFPKTGTEDADLSLLREKWEEIRAIIRSVPTSEECKTAMQKAGCKITVEDIGKAPGFFWDCFRYSPYMRYRLTLLRLKDCIVLH